VRLVEVGAAGAAILSTEGLETSIHSAAGRRGSKEVGLEGGLVVDIQFRSMEFVEASS